MKATVSRDVISGLGGHPMSGLWVLGFESGKTAMIESGSGVRSLAACFGATEGKGDLLEKIVGKDIVYSTDPFGVLEGFTPAEDWPRDLPEVGEELEIDLEDDA